MHPNEKKTEWKPINVSEIESLEPIDPYQLTKEYGPKELFSNWEFPGLSKNVNIKLFSGYLQKMSCKYRDQNGRVIKGEWWHTYVNGFGGGMSDFVAPGYEIVRNGENPPTVEIRGDIQLHEFSQFLVEVEVDDEDD